jgi:thiol-disulfide isomerase/thioredoxin
MHILHINSQKDAHKVDKMIKQGNHVFILVYMEGCGPCNATRPEWEKMVQALKDQYSHNNKLVVIDVDKDYLSDIKHIGSIDGFPTIKYISNNGKNIESYDESSIKKKDRSVDSFINWIETNVNNTVSAIPTSSAKNVYQRIKTKKNHRVTSRKTRDRKIHKGGKWSRKYKLSINCKKPKGFSQKQYCKYGRSK